LAVDLRVSPGLKELQVLDLTIALVVKTYFYWSGLPFLQLIDYLQKMPLCPHRTGISHKSCIWVSYATETTHWKKTPPIPWV
jgi:hypothetical protein